MNCVKGVILCIGLLSSQGTDARCWGLMKIMTYSGGFIFLHDGWKTSGEDSVSVPHLIRTVDRFSHFTTVNDIIASKTTKNICTKIVNFSTYCGEKLTELIKEGARNLESRESVSHEQPEE